MHMYVTYPKYLLVCCFLYIKAVLSLHPLVLPSVLPIKPLEKPFKDYRAELC